MNLDDVYRLEIRKLRLTIFEGRAIAHEAFLSPYILGGWRLSVRHDLHGPEKIVAAGLQIARLMLRQDFFRSGYRTEYLNRRDWRLAEEWLAKRLIRPSALGQACRQEWPAWMLAEEANVTMRLAEVAIAGWLAQKGQIVDLPPPSETVKRSASLWCEM